MWLIGSFPKQLVVMHLLSLKDTSFSASPRQGFAKKDRVIYLGPYAAGTMSWASMNTEADNEDRCQVK